MKEVVGSTRRPRVRDTLIGRRKPLLSELFVVDKHVSARRERDRLSWEANHSLHQVSHPRPAAVFVGGTGEDHDVSSVDAVEGVAQLVDHDTVALVQSRIHRQRGYDVGLDDKDAEQGGDDNRYGRNDDDLSNERLGGWLLPLLSPEMSDSLESGTANERN
jgi:hypothetical protein